MKSNRNPLLNRSGQGLTEYMIIMILVAVASIAITTKLGNSVRNKISAAKNDIYNEVNVSRTNYNKPDTE